MLLAEFDAEKYERTIRQEGLEEGIEQGIEQGIKQGIKQGLAQGIKEGCLDNARRMIRAGKLSYEEIAEYTALPLEKVRELALA